MLENIIKLYQIWKQCPKFDRIFNLIASLRPFSENFLNFNFYFIMNASWKYNVVVNFGYISGDYDFIAKNDCQSFADWILCCVISRIAPGCGQNPWISKEGTTGSKNILTALILAKISNNYYWNMWICYIVTFSF